MPDQQAVPPPVMQPVVAQPSWSPQQISALTAVKTWLDTPSSPQIFRLFGFAGTGKTTLAIELAKHANGRVLFGAFTGKAALVLRRKGCYGAQTIHSMIYHPKEDPLTGKVEFTINPESPVIGSRLVIIDECSMVNEEMAVDLLGFGSKVLVLGDPAQLPPVSGAGYFTTLEDGDGPGSRPDVMLTEIHRQAEGNPIIAMSKDVREGRRLARGQYGTGSAMSKVISRAQYTRDDIESADIVLVGKNATRRKYNEHIRRMRGMGLAAAPAPGHAGAAIDPLPVVGDRLVCLKNNRTKGLLNGGLWDVAGMEGVKDGIVSLLVTSADVEAGAYAPMVKVRVPEEFFLGSEDKLDWKVRRNFDEFDYGYALTVHKSQGSQWLSVLLIDESVVFRDKATEWLYTGITRAAERVVVVQS